MPLFSDARCRAYDINAQFPAKPSKSAKLEISIFMPVYPGAATTFGYIPSSRPGPGCAPATTSPPAKLQALGHQVILEELPQAA